MNEIMSAGTGSIARSDGPSLVETRSLFARVSRNAQVVLPLNASAVDPAASLPALYCVHSVTGAGARDFLPLARHLDGHVRTFGVQAPPHRLHEPEFGSRIVDLGATYADAIAARQPAGPLFIAGWSAGAVIAIEIARSLEARGRDVALVVAIDGAPELDAGARAWQARYWAQVLGNLPRWWRDCRAQDKGFPATNLVRHAISAANAMRHIVARKPSEPSDRLETFIGASFAMYPTIQRRFMARFYEAACAHRPLAWDGPLHVYEAQVSRLLSPPSHLANWLLVAPRAERTFVPGNHHTMMLDPHAGALARDLHAHIAARATACANKQAAS